MNFNEVSLDLEIKRMVMGLPDEYLNKLMNVCKDEIKKRAISPN